MAFVTTAEVCDANQELIRSGQLRALQPIFQIYGRRQIFSGPVVTVKVFEDNGLIRQFIEEKGNEMILQIKRSKISMGLNKFHLQRETCGNYDIKL